METNAPATLSLYDMHCHLGFAPDAESVRRCLAAQPAAALSCTVTPAEWQRDAGTFAGLPHVHVALGLHPWQIAEGTVSEAELARFEELAAETPFIGEVGLDFAGERGSDSARAAQVKAFRRVLSACDAPSSAPRKVISIHAVKSAETVLDLLEAQGTCERHAVIFHWFSGTSADLNRAIASGCLFSVGPRMLATRRGRDYARQIPENRLLLETDSPAAPGDPWNCADWIISLNETIAQLAAIRTSEADKIAARTSETSKALLR